MTNHVFFENMDIDTGNDFSALIKRIRAHEKSLFSGDRLEEEHQISMSLIADLINHHMAVKNELDRRPPRLQPWEDKFPDVRFTDKVAVFTLKTAAVRSASSGCTTIRPGCTKSTGTK